MTGPILLVLLAASTSAFSQMLPEVDPTVNQFFKAPTPPNNATMILTLRDHPHLGSHANVLEVLEKTTTFLSREHRLNSVVQTLQNYTAATQRDLLDFLNAKKAKSLESTLEIHPLWITNKVIIKGADADLFNELAMRSDIARIEPDVMIPLFNPVPDPTNELKVANLTQNPNQWGVVKVKAPEAWNSGVTGKGIVVSVIDTGVRGTHVALRDNYRKDYSWFDPIEGTAKPTDTNGHGTHCAGSIGGTYGIGVAKEATLIACRGGTKDSLPTSALMQCGQWSACPTDVKGENADCSKAPHIVSNSWGRSGGGSDYYDDIIRTWRSQGIIPVFAVGNDGRKGCYTIGSPGDNPDSIGVGSTTQDDSISDFSSVGPNWRGGFKPDVTAPGSDILSAYHGSDDGLVQMSGTSMATPHVSGVIALMLSKNKSLTYDQIKQALIKGCEPVKSSRRDCGGASERKIPNHVSGNGRVNVMKSL